MKVSVGEGRPDMAKAYPSSQPPRSASHTVLLPKCPYTAKTSRLIASQSAVSSAQWMTDIVETYVYPRLLSWRIDQQCRANSYRVKCCTLLPSRDFDTPQAPLSTRTIVQIPRERPKAERSCAQVSRSTHRSSRRPISDLELASMHSIRLLALLERKNRGEQTS